MTPPAEHERNLIRLYQIILASVQNNKAAITLLDNFLAITGKSGIATRRLISLFMQSENGGSSSRLQFRAGLRALLRYGLLQEMPGQRSMNLSMHALTYRILRDLRYLVPLQIEMKYLDFLQSLEYRELQGEDSKVGQLEARLIQYESKVVRDVLPDGWAAFNCIDRSTWIAVLKSVDAEQPQEHYGVRFEVYDHGLYMVDYRSGERSSVDVDSHEGRQLRYLVTIYSERVLPELARLQRPDSETDDSDEDAESAIGNQHSSEGKMSDGEDSLDESTSVDATFPSQKVLTRLDSEVTPADGFKHLMIDPLTRSSCVEHQFVVWALCGKRLVPGPTTAAELCPDCERLNGVPERLTEFERAMHGFFSNIRLDEPLHTSYLYLIRGTIFRKLGRFDEAMGALEGADSFLRWVDTGSDHRRLALGEGIIRELLALPELPLYLPASLCGWLYTTIPQMPDPSKAWLLYQWSESLDEANQVDDVLKVYNELLVILENCSFKSLTCLDSSRRKKVIVDTGFILYKKSEAERKVGMIEEANATLQLAIVDAERRGNNRLQIALLWLMAALRPTTELEQARAEMQRATALARLSEPIDYEQIWKCLIYLASLNLDLGDSRWALDAAEEALEIANIHLASRSDLHEKSLREVARIRNEL